MIQKVVVFHCPECDSTNVVKNGKNSAGSQQFLCKDCRKSAVMYPQNQRSQEDKDQILSAYHERPSMRGIARTFHISRNTLKKLLKKKWANNRRSRKVCCLLKPTTCWNWMRFGHLSLSKQPNTGYGQPFVGVPAKSWLLRLGIGALKHASVYGIRFQNNIVPVTPSAIFGTHTRKFFRKKLIEALVRKQGDLPQGTLELYASPIVSKICPQNIILF